MELTKKQNKQLIKEFLKSCKESLKFLEEYNSEIDGYCDIIAKKPKVFKEFDDTELLRQKEKQRIEKRIELTKERIMDLENKMEVLNDVR